MSAATVEKETAIVYKIRPTDKQGGWADISIREWPRGGSIDIQSDFGNYAYSWNSTGDGTFREFLCRLDFDYFMSKTRGNHGQIFSFDKSIKALKDETIKQRKDNTLTKDDAQGCWDDIKNIEETPDESNGGFTRAIDQNHDLIDVLYGGDYCSIWFCQIDDPECVAFWERVWTVACDYWKEELNAT